MSEAIKIVSDSHEDLDPKYEITDFSLDGLEVLEESGNATTYAYDEETLTSILEVRRDGKRMFFVCEGEDCDEVGSLTEMPYVIAELPTYRLVGEIEGMTDTVIALNHSLNCTLEDITNGTCPEPATEAPIDPVDGIYAVQQPDDDGPYIALSADAQHRTTRLSRDTLEQILMHLQARADELRRQLNPNRYDD